MPNVNLSAEFVRTVPIPEAGKVNYFDNATVNFILEVRHTGGKTYALRYRDPHGRQRQHKIGDAQSISFDKARQAAQVLRSRVVLGESPSEDRKIKRAIPTLAEFSERYMTFVKGYKRSWTSDESYLKNHLLPKWGSSHLDAISQHSVIEFHHGMRAQGYAAATANRMVILLSFMYTQAKRWKVPGAETNPCIGVKLFQTVSRERFLTPAETQRLMLALEQSESAQLKSIVTLLLLLGCRRQELLGSRWVEFDLERRNWRIPMSKSGKPRNVPLSLAAVSLLSALPRWEGCPYVIPNPATRLPQQSFFASWDAARKRAGLADLRVHDLRHSFASNCVNSGRSIFEVANLLGHSKVDMSARYSHLSQQTLLAAVDAAANASGIDWGQAQPAKTGDNLAVADV